MNLLRISLFGGVCVTRCEKAEHQMSSAALTPTAQGLLAYLALYRHRVHPRDVLSELFWGDHTNEQAKGCLNTALWRLRRVIEPDPLPRGTYLLTNLNGDVAFNSQSDYWLDVAELEDAIKRILAQPVQLIAEADARATEVALDLYKGELLEGFHDDWAIRERERLHCLYINGLAHLAAYYKLHNDLGRGIHCCQRILALDPLREDIHREAMRFFSRGGQRAMAAQQYETCRLMLDQELGIEPMLETRALYAQVLAQTEPVEQPALRQAFIQADHEKVPALQQALTALKVAQLQLHQVMQVVEQAMQRSE